MPSHRGALVLSGSQLTTVLGAPAGARVLDVDFDAFSDSVRLVVEHEEWSEPEERGATLLELLGVTMTVGSGEMSDAEIGAVVRQQVQRIDATTCTLLVLRPRRA